MDRILQALSLQVTGARDLESLTRPLLEMLETVTGLESTYLTEIDLGHDTQHIRFARNAATLQIPEGARCSGAMPSAGGPSTRGASTPRMWRAAGGFPGGAGPWHSHLPELPGADPFGLPLWHPVRRQCRAKPLTAGSDHLIAFFARLIAEQVEREQLLQQLQQANHELSRQALSDPLTGLPNRRALMHELNRLFSLAERVEHPLLLGFIDLDGFKAINDTHGHDTGDLLLQRVAAALSTVLRGSDLLARWG